MLTTKKQLRRLPLSCLARSGKQDSNLRPPGPKPGALPSGAISRNSAEDRDRTGTVITNRRILSPVRLPIPPPRHNRTD